jgi:hypothetical protein
VTHRLAELLALLLWRPPISLATQLAGQLAADVSVAAAAAAAAAAAVAGQGLLLAAALKLLLLPLVSLRVV